MRCGPFDDTLDPQRLAEEASSSPGPLSLITLRQSDRDQVAAVLGERPGLVITPQAELLPTDEHFAPAIVGEVKKAVVNDLDGQAGWRVVSVNQNGADVDVLNEVPGRPRRRSRSAWIAPFRTPRRTPSTGSRARRR